MQERIKLAPSQAHTYNNPAVNHLFVQATVTTILVAGASAGVALAMPWQLQNRPKKNYQTSVLKKYGQLQNTNAIFCHKSSECVVAVSYLQWSLGGGFSTCTCFPCRDTLKYSSLMHPVCWESLPQCLSTILPQHHMPLSCLNGGITRHFTPTSQQFSNKQLRSKAVWHNRATLNCKLHFKE